ncbi:MAG: hypothetical protein M5U12_00010 [Verrucomicrobia bacterium]|nr:hypothetical protein [Verrucomicrobiota bacterium]
MISPQQCSTPLPELVGRLNRHLRGWANYFGLGYPRNVFRHLNHFVRYRLGQHLQRRSQRGWRARKGSACTRTWNGWDWFVCECVLEETTLARAGWGKSPCPVRRGRGERRSLVLGPFIPCSPLYSTGLMLGPFWMSDGSPSNLPLCPSHLCGSRPSGSATETRGTQGGPRWEGRGRPRCRGQNGRLAGGNLPSRSNPNMLITNA